MSWLIPNLEAFGEIEIEFDEVMDKLLSISASSTDSLLKEEKRKLSLKKRKSAKPGSFLKNQISVRTFADWETSKAGFMEMDLVSHEGGNPGGEFTFTLTLTDVCSDWTENKAVKKRAQKWTFEAINLTREIAILVKGSRFG